MSPQNNQDRVIRLVEMLVGLFERICGHIILRPNGSVEKAQLWLFSDPQVSDFMIANLRKMTFPTNQTIGSGGSKATHLDAMLSKEVIRWLVTLPLFIFPCLSFLAYPICYYMEVDHIGIPV